MYLSSIFVENKPRKLFLYLSSMLVKKFLESKLELFLKIILKNYFLKMIFENFPKHALKSLRVIQTLKNIIITNPR